MAVSKVVLGNETLIDLTGDSVSSENLLLGETAHGANGEEVIGGVVVTPMYTGTKAAIEEAIALGQIPEDAVVNITDDEETSSFQTQINEINSSLTTYFNFWIDNGYLPDPNVAPLIPVMTSNTTPYGEAFADSEFNDSIKAYMVFDGDDTTEWAPNQNSAAFGSAYVGYKFNNPSCIKSVLIGSRTSSAGNLRIKGFRIEASNDCISWDAIFNSTFEDSIASGSNVRYKQKFSFNNDKRYLAYRLVILSGETAPAIEVNTLQFYGN